MGHTRMTTQGSEMQNCNNHPFYGVADGNAFALAHNGILSNDKLLRLEKKLPASRIETDSFAIVQLLEQAGTIDLDTLRITSELLRGSFTYTVLDDHEHLYIVRGNNPFRLYHFPKQKVYLYASTKEILNYALSSIRKSLHGPVEEVAVREGDILCLLPDGGRSRGTFSVRHLYDLRAYDWPLSGAQSTRVQKVSGGSYARELKNLACAFGYTPEDVDTWLGEGLQPEEIEECFYYGEI